MKKVFFIISILLITCSIYASTSHAMHNCGYNEQTDLIGGPDQYCESDGGGAIPPDADEFLSSPPVVATESAKKVANPSPIGGCWKDDPKARIAPVSWYWPVYKNVHLQVYDSKGAWWFNGWVKSNSYTVFSKDGKGQFPGVPTDGRTVYAKVSYGGSFSPVGTINCSLR